MKLTVWQTQGSVCRRSAPTPSMSCSSGSDTGPCTALEAAPCGGLSDRRGAQKAMPTRVEVEALLAG